MNKKNIFLLFGGRSPEHEISIITAKQALHGLDKEKYNVYPIYYDKEQCPYYIPNFHIFQTFSDFNQLKMLDLRIELHGNKRGFYLGRFKKLPQPDTCLLTFHGGYGESGNMQGFLDVLDIPYTGPSMKSAVLGMDKDLMKRVLSSHHIPTLTWMCISQKDWERDQKKLIDNIHTFSPYPLIVKGSSLGSSIGVTMVSNDKDCIEAIDLNFLYGNRIIIEPFLTNILEVNCSVRKIANNVYTSPLEEIQKSGDTLFSYEEKYVKGGKKSKIGVQDGMATATRRIPAPIHDSLTKQIQETAKQVFLALHGEGVMRIDFFVDPTTASYYVIEPNTIPGALSFYLWEAEGKQFHEVLDGLIDEAIRLHKEKHTYITSFDSPLLHL